jgi:uncharacterized protein YbaP (TraB family)
MKRLLILSICFLAVSFTYGQLIIKEKKYPSLLWEITGKGSKKPSYLIGTMHVSNKLAFNLPDSFYIALKSAQVVALETNPETWQADMDKYEIGNSNYTGNNYSSYSLPSDFLTINTFKFYPYYPSIERALYSNSSAINSLLYRSYGNTAADFEEDTYLDMYIFQCGKKLGKKVAGVEDYGQSMRLMTEAYQDAAKDKDRKNKTYSEGAQDYSMDKLQEAYRTGNLDLLDTINKFNSTSAAFDEKFLYRRNEIQAQSIDSIIKAGNTLFVGVGAAHLPGQRGVIEMLRRMGYKLRPIKMGERNSREKDIVDKIRVPVKFNQVSSDDGMYKVDIPGKFYKVSEESSINQQQYADMANGSYYIVSRITTNAWMWGHNEAKVLSIVDSLLYENVPGKILSKTPLSKNNYKGIDIINRTRRGDVQRSQIFVTPFEILFFKMSGNGDYVKNGEEPNRFFNSIYLKEFGKLKTEMPAQWKVYTPPSGGFSVALPHEPAISNDGSLLFDAIDKSANIHFRVIRSDIHNFNLIGEDTLDVGLMEESFMSSQFIESVLYRKQNVDKGYPVLDGKYKGKYGGIFVTRFLIQGPHYYALIAYSDNEQVKMQNFINSFQLIPFKYGISQVQTDTTLRFSVSTPVYPSGKKIKLDMPGYADMGFDGDVDDSEEIDYLNGAVFKAKLVESDSTGEKIYVSMFKWSSYFYTKDSSLLDDEKKISLDGDTSWIIRYRKSEMWPDGTRVRETIISDTGSSRTLWGKTFYKNGVFYLLNTAYDTITTPSEFVKNFFQTFKPADTIKGVNPFERKTDSFFRHLASSDSVLQRKAIKQIDVIDIDSTDFDQLVNAIASRSWAEKKYLKIKSGLISRLGEIKTKMAADYLKKLYYSTTDTLQLQYPILENLLQQKTAYAFSLFKEIIVSEPPVMEKEGGYAISSDYGLSNQAVDNNSFFDELGDSLALTKKILPDLLPLLNLADYKTDMMELLKKMVDSNIVTTVDYEIYVSKFLIEAKQELRKQLIAEKKKLIDEAEDSKKEKKLEGSYDKYKQSDGGNEDLTLYSTLLLPFTEKNTLVMPLLEQMLKSNDKRLKYNTLMLLVKNKKTHPDTLIKYFAALDEYRYELYTDLKKAKCSNKFPSLYKNHVDLALSKLYHYSQYEKPDSIIFLERLYTTNKGQNGFIYFFKYKESKDDLIWKLATVGLVPTNASEIEFEGAETPPKYKGYDEGYTTNSKSDFTDFTNIAIREEEPIAGQLVKHLKRLLYGKRKSAARFYGTENTRQDEYDEY